MNTTYRNIATIAVCLILRLIAMAQNDTTIVVQLMERKLETQALLQLAWDNPAVKQWQRSKSLSQVGLQWRLRHEDEAVVSQQGDHEATYVFDAKTYMKHKSSTLWGRAYYHNGQQRGMRWNETSDIDVVYPYLLADSVDSHPMKLERYSFMGGYADTHGRLAWGATVGYKAGLYYRNVDPRPRNVTADLDISAGLAYQLAKHYFAACHVAYNRYKQTNNVAFYSELGNEKLYHLTGLANDYGRFAGTGYNTFYRGNKWIASLGLHPDDNHGISATIQAVRLAFDNVLTSINKLPIAHLTHNAIVAEGAWLDDTWSVRAHGEASRRVGTEYVFGDPAAQVYPQIGALDMFHENRLSLGVDATWHRRWEEFAVGLLPAFNYHHLNVIYADPQSHLKINDMAVDMRLWGGVNLGRVFTTITIGAKWVNVVDKSLSIGATKDELIALRHVVEHDYIYQSNNRILYTAQVNLSVPIGSDYALQACVDWMHGNYHNNNHVNHITTSINFIF